MYCKADGCVDRTHRAADGLFDQWNERTSRPTKMLELRTLQTLLSCSIGSLAVTASLSLVQPEARGALLVGLTMIIGDMSL